MTSYCAKLTGEDLSRYLNKTESVGLREACLVPAPGRRSDCKCRNMLTFPRPASRWPEQLAYLGMSKLRHCQPMYSFRWKCRSSRSKRCQTLFLTRSRYKRLPPSVTLWRPLMDSYCDMYEFLTDKPNKKTPKSKSLSDINALRLIMML